MKDQHKWQIEKGEQGSTGVGRAGGAEVSEPAVVETQTKEDPGTLFDASQWHFAFVYQ
jgi:hypothetical protein